MQSFATKTKRAIQKVAAITTGVAMMGSTITGALALSVKLNDYPTAFKDALVVVGTAANGADDIAAADISGDIPTTAKVSQISGDTYTIEKSGNKWNMNQDMHTIDGSITDTELDLLADQTLKDDEGTDTGDHDYTQTLFIPVNSSTLLFAADASGNREGRPVNDYLKFSSSSDRWAYTYTLKLTGTKMTIKDSADLENNVVSILGRDWTITDVSMSNTTYGNINKITLLAGDVMSTILQGSTVGGVTVVDVDEAETKCIIEYAGKTYIVDKGQTKTFDDGTIVGVTDVTAVHEAGAGQDMCELAIGAHKLTLENGKKVNINNEDVDNSNVFISGNGTTGITPGLKQINISYQPEDDVWLAKSEALEDPVFGAFKFVYNNLVEKDIEEIKVDIVSDKIRLKVANRDGDVFDDYYCFLNGTGTARNFALGYSDLKPMIVYNQQNISNTSLDVSGVAAKSMKQVRFLMSFNGVSHIAEIQQIDTSNNKTTIKLLDSGEVYKDMDYVDGAVTTFDDIDAGLRIAYNIYLQGGIAQAGGQATINFTNINDGGPVWFTKNDGNLTFLNASGGYGVPAIEFDQFDAGGTNYPCDLQFSENAGYSTKTVEADTAVLNSANGLNISFRYDPTDNQIEWNRTGSNSLGTRVTMLKKDDDSQYDYRARTAYGTRIEQYQKDDGDLTIYYPSEPVYAEVIIAASEAVTGTLATANVVKETDVTDVAAQNVILVGGPCANGLTAQFTGEVKTTPECTANYKAGEAILKLMDNGNKVALIVAGYSADDTKRAAVALGGSLPAKTEAKVTGSSLELSDIEVM
ncbi:MAG: hypothetical protein PHF86_10805 [Candidatus Nanoarchaeia archaeon]|nr:hypothetical protein [Candidatus Nanoarchaeia archaeon]